MNTVTIDSAVNISGIQTFPIISYVGPVPAAGAFVKGALPTGFAANLVNNTVQKRIDLVIAPKTAVTPRMNGVFVSGTNLILGGTNGFPNGYYTVLTSTNLTLPYSQWRPLTTNPFDGSGGFNTTNPLDPSSPQLFYLLQLQ